MSGAGVSLMIFNFLSCLFADNIARATRAAPDATRRELLKLGATLPFFVLGASLPTRAFARLKVDKNAPLPEKKPRAPRLLMIDPGHGGNDPGTISRKGIKEKDITLDIAKHMAAALSGRSDVHVKLTRETDVYLPILERVKMGRMAGADLFVSVHADSAPNSSARGLSCYTLSERASDDLANALAEKENHADFVGGVDLSQAEQDVAAILYDLTARRTHNTALRVKVSFVRAMSRHFHLLENPMRSANFAVLRAPDIPSLLVETGFLSNSRDEALLRQIKHRKTLAKRMAKEVASILNSPLFG
jgi:N-acetylmuramoyl-L-alanine amidase